MKKILCIGNVSYDITIVTEDYPTENIKYRVDNRVTGGGGPSSNAAYLLGKWGVPTSFAGTIGNDEYGRKILEEFKSVNVNTTNVQIERYEDTTSSFILVNKKNGSRTIFAYRPNNLKLKKKIKTRASVILIDGQEYDASVQAIKNNPKAISIIDAGRNNDKVIALCKMVDYVVCSKEFAEHYTNMKIDLSNPSTIKSIFQVMEHDFKNVLITLESKGCLYRLGDDIKLMPSIKVVSKDSTGAGDFFHGAFAYCIANNFDIEKSVMISNITGALSVTKVGSRNSVPSLNEVMRIYKNNVR